MDLPEPEFKALISEYLLILGSKYIDDESLYLKHHQKQAQLQDTHALRQLSVLQQFDAITKEQWAICALSGVNTNKSFELTQGNKTIHIDAVYGPFARQTLDVMMMMFITIFARD